MSPPDYWIAQTIGRNVHETWHRYRHIPSGAGGTYGWWLVCGEDGQGPFVGDPEDKTAPEPPKGARVCRRCRAGVGRWESPGVPTVSDVLHNIFGAAP